MSVAFAIIDLLDYVKSYKLRILGIFGPIIEFASKLRPKYFIENLLRHYKLYKCRLLNLTKIPLAVTK